MKSKWQVKFRNSVGGIILTGARRRGRGPIYHPRFPCGGQPAHEIPKELEDCLCLRHAGGYGNAWHLDLDAKNIVDAARAINENGFATARVFRGNLIVECEIESPKLAKHKSRLKLIQQIAKDIGCDSLGKIYHRIYKASRCGISLGFLEIGRAHV